MYSTIHLHYIGLQNPQGKVPKHDDSPIRGGFKLNVCGKPGTLETSANGAFVRILRMPGGHLMGGGDGDGKYRRKRAFALISRVMVTLVVVNQ
jgi:hypothetical protein